jgi:hypothetical protein
MTGSPNQGLKERTLDHDLVSLFELDLRANAWRLSRGKPVCTFRIMLQCQAVHLQRGEMLRPRQTDVAPFPCSLGLLADISRRSAVPRISLKFTGIL